jgi:hypothetical protein
MKKINHVVLSLTKASLENKEYVMEQVYVFAILAVFMNLRMENELHRNHLSIIGFRLPLTFRENDKIIKKMIR